MFLVLTCLPSKSYCSWFRSVFLCLCDVFEALINFLSCWVLFGGFKMLDIFLPKYRNMTESHTITCSYTYLNNFLYLCLYFVFRLSESFVLAMTSCPQIEQALKHCLDFSAARKVQSDLMGDVSDTLSKVSVGKGDNVLKHVFTSIYLPFGQKLFPLVQTGHG